MNNLYANNISEGDLLPKLTHTVTASCIVLGAVASRDWRPMHHDVTFARERSGKADIFMNSPTQAAWFERYINEVCGPLSRLRRLAFTMKRSIYPSAQMLISGEVVRMSEVADGLVDVTLRLSIADVDSLCSECTALISMPASEGANPWQSAS